MCKNSVRELNELELKKVSGGILIGDGTMERRQEPVMTNRSFGGQYGRTLDVIDLRRV